MKSFNKTISFNGNFARKIKSIKAAILFDKLLRKKKLFTIKGKLVSHKVHGEEWFEFSIHDMENASSLTRKQQDTAIRYLKLAGYATSKVFGLPAKRYFKILKEDE